MPEILSAQNVIVFVICEGLGMPFCYSAADRMLNNDPKAALIGFAVGLPLCILGGVWPWIRKQQIPVWLVTLLMVITWGASGYDLYERQFGARNLRINASETAHGSDSATISPTRLVYIATWGSFFEGAISAALIVGLPMGLLIVLRRRRMAQHLAPTRATRGFSLLDAMEPALSLLDQRRQIVGRLDRSTLAGTDHASVGIQSPQSGTIVDLFADVRGIVYPANTPVQVLVYSGDKLWHPQGGLIQADRHTWSKRCQFGNKQSTGGRHPHQLIAIAGVDPIDKPVPDLPPDAIQSEIVNVVRRASDEDRRLTPEGSGAIAEGLRKYAPFDVGILIYKTTGEAMDFVKDLSTALSAAGWTTRWATRTDQAFLKGLAIEADVDTKRHVYLAGADLLQILQSLHIAIYQQVTNSQPPSGDVFTGESKDRALAAPLRIYVGEHPRGY